MAPLLGPPGQLFGGVVEGGETRRWGGVHKPGSGLGGPLPPASGGCRVLLMLGVELEAGGCAKVGGLCGCYRPERLEQVQVM